MMRLIALVSVVAFAPRAMGQEADGGVPSFSFPSVAKITKAIVELPDAGEARVEGGCWLSESKCIDVAKQKAGYEARIAELEAQPPQMSLGVVLACVGGAAAIALAGGVVIGYTVKK